MIKAIAAISGLLITSVIGVLILISAFVVITPWINMLSEDYYNWFKCNIEEDKFYLEYVCK